VINVKNVALYIQPTSAEQAGAILTVILICIALLLFGGFCFSYGLKLITKSAYKMAKEVQRKKAEEKRYRKTVKGDTTKLWLCPICGHWQEDPELHLKEYHVVSDDMLDFWIEKGKWL
jgi:ribosomal protein L37AE/L43A